MRAEFNEDVLDTMRKHTTSDRGQIARAKDSDVLPVYGPAIDRGLPRTTHVGRIFKSDEVFRPGYATVVNIATFNETVAAAEPYRRTGKLEIAYTDITICSTDVYQDYNEATSFAMHVGVAMDHDVTYTIDMAIMKGGKDVVEDANDEIERWGAPRRFYGNFVTDELKNNTISGTFDDEKGEKFLIALRDL